MNTDTGETEKQRARKPPKVGRNDICPCGSQKKFKRCCWKYVGERHGGKR